MNRNQIRRIERIRSIDERSKDMAAIELGKVAQKLVVLDQRLVDVDEQFRKISSDIQLGGADLEMLKSGFNVGIQGEQRKQQIAEEKDELVQQQSELLSNLRSLQVRIDQWNQLLEKMEMQLVAEEAHKANVDADEAFLANHLRDRS